MNNLYKRVLITGAAGFIGSALVSKFLNEDYEVLGIDNLNDYYDIKLKEQRIHQITKQFQNNKNWLFKKESIENFQAIIDIFKTFKPEIVVHLAAQAGVRYSISNPYSYVKSNLIGFYNILEASRLQEIKHFVYASSSSVYGGNKKIPFSEIDSVDHPISFYAATKKSNELMAHSYSHIYKLPTTGLRYFTVYGPWGRPDMAPMIFAKAILKKEEISVFNNGNMERDFTYIDDIVDGTYSCCIKPAKIDNQFFEKKLDPSTSFAPYRIFNIGNQKKVSLIKFISMLEDELGIKAKKVFLPAQPGDILVTQSEIRKLSDWTGYNPKVDFREGIKKFASWYKNYYGY